MTVMGPAARAETGVGGGDRPLEAVRRELGRLAARIASATCDFLALVAELDRREGWAGQGITSCAHWLSIYCGLSSGAAREQVRVARALEHLPRTQEMFRAGRLSFSKVRALTRVATSEDEAELLAVALSATANQLERLVSGIRRAESLADVNVRHARRSLTWREEEDGSTTFTVRCDPEDAATILETLEQFRDVSEGGHPQTGSGDDDADSGGGPVGEADGVSAETPTGRAASMLDALVLLCANAALPGKEPGEWREALGSRRSETVLHATLEDLADAGGAHAAAPAHTTTPAAAATAESGRGRGVARSGSVGRLVGPRLELGPVLHPETARRLTCDTGVTLMLHKRSTTTSGHGVFTVVPSARPGATIDVGKRRRLATARQLKALWERDQGCRYPGCGRRRFLHAHHVIHWSRGGRTDLCNLVLVCSTHHRLLHEGEYTLRLDHEARAITILSPTGRVVARSGYRPDRRTLAAINAAGRSPLPTISSHSTIPGHSDLGSLGSLGSNDLSSNAALPLEPLNPSPLAMSYAVGVIAENRALLRTPDGQSV